MSRRDEAHDVLRVKLRFWTRHSLWLGIWPAELSPSAATDKLLGSRAQLETVVAFLEPGVNLQEVVFACFRMLH